MTPLVLEVLGWNKYHLYPVICSVPKSSHAVGRNGLSLGPITNVRFHIKSNLWSLCGTRDGRQGLHACQADSTVSSTSPEHSPHIITASAASFEPLLPPEMRLGLLLFPILWGWAGGLAGVRNGGDRSSPVCSEPHNLVISSKNASLWNRHLVLTLGVFGVYCGS